MAETNMVELVIKIPEKVYEEIMAHYRERPEDTKSANYFERLVLNGTPLPKEHGDLIDRRELIKNGVSRGFCDWYDEIKYADTIIEADDKNKEKSATSYDSNEEDREI